MLGVDGISDFDGLHSRKHDDEVEFYAFDCLVSDGKDIRKLPLSMRKANLARLLARRHLPESGVQALRWPSAKAELVANSVSSRLMVDVRRARLTVAANRRYLAFMTASPYAPRSSPDCGRCWELRETFFVKCDFSHARARSEQIERLAQRHVSSVTLRRQHGVIDGLRGAAARIGHPTALRRWPA